MADKIDIGELKYADVSTFRGTTKIHFREWYEKNGEVKRTQKGVTFTADEWKDLKANWEDIVEFIDGKLNEQRR